MSPRFESESPHHIQSALVAGSNPAGRTILPLAQYGVASNFGKSGILDLVGPRYISKFAKARVECWINEVRLPLLGFFSEFKKALLVGSPTLTLGSCHERSNHVRVGK